MFFLFLTAVRYSFRLLVKDNLSQPSSSREKNHEYYYHLVEKKIKNDIFLLEMRFRGLESLPFDSALKTKVTKFFEKIQTYQKKNYVSKDLYSNFRRLKNKNW